MMNGTAPLTVSVTRDEDGIVCAIGGQMTRASYEVFRPVLDMVHGPDDGPVILDLERLLFLDSNGLGMLLILSEAARERGRRLHLVNIPRRIQRVLDQTNTHRLLVQ